MAMDDTDRKLISLLRKDARMTAAALAAKLGVSRGTIANRLRKLEDEQVIVGYSVRLRPAAEPATIKAWMSVVVEGNQTRAVIAALLGEPAVASSCATLFVVGPGVPGRRTEAALHRTSRRCELCTPANVVRRAQWLRTNWSLNMSKTLDLIVEETIPGHFFWTLVRRAPAKETPFVVDFAMGPLPSKKAAIAAGNAAMQRASAASGAGQSAWNGNHAETVSANL